ncbi:c-type cytochrome [Brevirhabdus sp.]|uniref:c-type cytochrome n=1 Tax=Brevirhabdus sp. TaxID=2004514 RepID=UPI0040588442
MRKLIIIAVVLLVALWGWWTSRPVEEQAQKPTEGAAIASVTVPDNITGQAALGKNIFNAKCAVCHGKNAAGQEGIAPPLVHKIYEPSHHADAAFLIAAQNGVRSHHWNFGNMPPVEGVTPADIKSVVAYIRTLQRANGIN